MTSVTIQEAQAALPELIQRLTPGDVLVITENDRPVATLAAARQPEPAKTLRMLGTMRGTVLSMDHFDDPLEDFKEYRQ